LDPDPERSPARPASDAAKDPPQEQVNALIALYSQGNFHLVLQQAEEMARDFPRSFAPWQMLGAAQFGLGHLDQAVRAFLQACDAKPDHAPAWNNLGAARYAQGKLDEAVAAYRRAIALQPDHADAHNNLGAALYAQGVLDAAVDAHQRAIALAPDHVDAHNNLGVALTARGELDHAIAAHERAIALAPNYAEAHSNLGNALHAQGLLEPAIAAYRRAIALKPGYADAHSNLGNVLHEQGSLDAAIAAYQRALAINPNNAPAEADLLHLWSQSCDWRHLDHIEEAAGRLGIGTKAVPPFAMLSAEDNAERHLARARTWASERYRHAPVPFPASPLPKSSRLRIGYFSADFHDHATLYLMAGLLREHDQQRFEIFAYSYGRKRIGDARTLAQNAVHHFSDVADMPNRAVVELARSHGLDIAIDLKGYTQNTRSGLFQFRVAPIQVNYLGYPGSMGAGFIDYIVADPILIPESQRQFYTERVIYLPHSYQPNDDQRAISSQPTTRGDFGLPRDAFVLCCFNSNYKIGLREFDIWMRLLGKIERGVLWLFQSNEHAQANLRREAAARGIDPSRLVFAVGLPVSQHLARHRHADLFVDTFNYNAHTTASDALWAGLPVVTKVGQHFAARVAASLLHAVGLPELVATTEGAYEALIIDLATNPATLDAVRRKLAANRSTQPLFDTKRYARNFESGLRKAHDLHASGRDPEDIVVAEDVLLAQG
jgi:predicted O-linked N-acetylglucosamine transferase (SPINDLY family)